MSNQLLDLGRNVHSRFGMGKTLGCVGIGCMVPLSCMLLFVCSLWWVVPTDMITDMFVSGQTEQAAPRAATRSSGSSLANGQVMQVGPTPVYPATNEQGGVRQAGAQSMMYNQPAQSNVPMQPYVAYQPAQGWEDSLASKSAYLARANLTGERRTPYTKGQVLTYPDGTVMTVVTGDYNFMLLEDQHGDQWMCGPSVNTLNELSGCRFWR